MFRYKPAITKQSHHIVSLVVGAQQYLYLHDNDLTGTIGKELSKLTELKLLSLESNRLTGDLPASIFADLSNLEMLYVHDNPISGTVPPTVADLRNLSQLTLSDTLLSGSLPTELLRLEKLSLVTVHHTSLSGTIPDGLCEAITQDENNCSTIDVYWEKCRYQWTNKDACVDSELCGCSCSVCE